MVNSTIFLPISNCLFKSFFLTNPNGKTMFMFPCSTRFKSFHRQFIFYEDEADSTVLLRQIYKTWNHWRICLINLVTCLRLEALYLLCTSGLICILISILPFFWVSWNAKKTHILIQSNWSIFFLTAESGSTLCTLMVNLERYLCGKFTCF